ncbi:hypothetical protein BGZ72_007180 [Mortierella alpina]|nr:hypothetical protein BGZ72_007180 [Mortierella alpina]
MATRSARTADKSINDKHTRILKALLQKPGNKYCVDCRKKDPRWASFNLGCFMCIRCSGVHRSMGTHISKVKSVDLDSWTTDQVENMIKWGNEKANLYWEARLPEKSIPNENTSGIDPWIRSKYEWKQFTNKEPIPDPSELGPIDEAMLMDLHGKSDGHRVRAHADRSSDTSAGSFGIIAPPPSNPSRSSTAKRSSLISSGVQGADLFAIGQQRPSSANSRPVSSANEDVFGLNAPVPSNADQNQSNKRTSIPPPPQQQPSQNSASQDLFSLVAPAPSTSVQAPPSSAAQTQPVKGGSGDWKNSIMSLYGNQTSTSNRNSTGFNIGQQMQQQQQQTGQFGQMQGMGAFGHSQQPQHQQSQQYQFQQQNAWGGHGGFGDMQQASGQHSTGSMGMGSAFGNGLGGQMGSRLTNTATSGGMGMGNSMGTNNSSSVAVPQGGDFFNMIAGATQTPAVNPTAQNKNNR